MPVYFVKTTVAQVAKHILITYVKKLQLWVQIPPLCIITIYLTKSTKELPLFHETCGSEDNGLPLVHKALGSNPSVTEVMHFQSFFLLLSYSQKQQQQKKNYWDSVAQLVKRWAAIAKYWVQSPPSLMLKISHFALYPTKCLKRQHGLWESQWR